MGDQNDGKDDEMKEATTKNGDEGNRDEVQKCNLISNRDKLLRINGYHLEDSEEENMILEDLDDEEEAVEESLEDLDPLYLIIPVSLDERKE